MSNHPDSDYTNIDVLLESLLNYGYTANNTSQVQKDEHIDDERIIDIEGEALNYNSSKLQQNCINDASSKIQYISGPGIGKMCKCSLKCPDKVTNEERFTIYNEFCNLDSYSKQNSYISSCIKNVPIKRRRRVGDPQTFYKQNTFIYTVKINGRNIRLCKTAFMTIHGLQRNRGRLNKILTMVKSSSYRKTTLLGNAIKQSLATTVEKPIIPLYYACDLDELINKGNLVTVYMISLAHNINP